MKNNIVISIVLAACLLFTTNCTDLVEEPIGLFAPESFFKTPSDVSFALQGAYAEISTESFYGRKLLTTLMLRSDMCDIGNKGTPGRRVEHNIFNVGTNNGMITAFWPRAYRIIGAANTAIEGAEQLDNPDTPEVRALIAEGRFIRAFTYFHLVRLFGELPYIGEAIQDPTSVSDLGKSSVDDIYQNIIADFEYGVENLPDSPVSGSKSRAYKGSALAYLSLVHLTLRNWDEAYNNARTLITNREQYATGLAEDYANIFDATISNGFIEHLFVADFRAETQGRSDFMGPMTGVNGIVPNQNPNETPNAQGWSVIVPSQRVFDSWDDNDYRKEVSFITEGYNSNGELVGPDQFALNFGATRPHIKKYFTKCGNSAASCHNSDNNYIGMRFGEVLLIAAEALNEVGGSSSEVVGYINELRARARNAAGEVSEFPLDLDASLSQNDLRAEILEERRLELAFEFKRWYDIVRLQLGTEVFADGGLEPQANFTASRDYLLPLPQDELDRNANLQPQNPGY